MSRDKTVQTKHIPTKLVLEAYDEAVGINYATGYPHEIIMAETDCCTKVAMNACERERDAGFIQGSPLPTGYLSKKGRAKLAELQAHEKEPA